MTVVTRFAPSPTGHLHIGGARTALFCWAFARGRGGKFLLRIEDTDQARSSESASRGILEDLAWLGIDWDEGPAFTGENGRTIGGDPRGVGPFYQAQRRDVYERELARLIEAERAYACFETPEELDAKRKEAAARKEQYRYDRAALSIPLAERKRRVASGEAHVVRFRMPDTAVRVKDEVLGDIEFGDEQLEDFVIRKGDGFPTYHFAVVVDDECMGVTHVLRGQEHLNNTPKHVALQHALGYKTPVYAHLPLIFNPDGSKMSKRDKDKTVREVVKKKHAGVKTLAGIDEATFGAWLKDSRSQLELSDLVRLAHEAQIDLPEIAVEDFRATGYIPRVVCNYIALLGWSPGGDVERFGMDFLSERFGVDRIGKTASKFDRVKLRAFNADTVAAMSDDEFIAGWEAWCERYDRDLLAKTTPKQRGLLAGALKPRTHVWREARTVISFLLVADDAVEFDPKAVDKALRKNDGLAILARSRDALSALGSFDEPTVHAALESLAGELGGNMGVVAQPLRVALTGGLVSPPLGATLEALGRDSSLKRIDGCLSAFR